MAYPYSVLMSVYAGENAVNLRAAIDSVLASDFPASEFVLVIDGPVDSALQEVINSYPSIKKVPLPVNQGLGAALNEGLKHTSYDIVARMDSDDICTPSRMGHEYSKISEGLDIVSSAILEFEGDIGNITGRRDLPLTQDEIVAFSKKRNPFNHPSVMFRKSAVIAAGGYTSEFPLFEDYDLWIRMLMKGARVANLPEPLLYMRTDEGMFLRRGGREYGRIMLSFHRSLRDRGWTSRKDYLTGAVPHYLVCVMPEFIRRGVYRRLHRRL
ncbi:MAG: glycosyltransferase [Clostridiales bacterium]|nr:glycosyltransferase [Clostridiales bacterium]